MVKKQQTSRPRKERESQDLPDENMAPDAGSAAPLSVGEAQDIDDLLDEIDEVLETNAEEFVKGYVQKGGQ